MLRLKPSDKRLKSRSVSSRLKRELRKKQREGKFKKWKRKGAS